AERAATVCPIRLANGSIHHGALLSSSPGSVPGPNRACYSPLTSDFPQPPCDGGFSSSTMETGRRGGGNGRANLDT
ncbi:hypothetical protein KUCAC02_028980, partial [Chaenocephalus aceratus]